MIVLKHKKVTEEKTTDVKNGKVMISFDWSINDVAISVSIHN